MKIIICVDNNELKTANRTELKTQTLIPSSHDPVASVLGSKVAHYIGNKQ